LRETLSSRKDRQDRKEDAKKIISYLSRSFAGGFLR